MSKLPNENQLQVVRNSTDDIWKIEDLLHMIKKEVEAHETSEQVEKNESLRKPPIGKPPFEKLPIPTASSLVANRFGGKPIKFAYCKEYHFPASCERVKDRNQRKES